ncbi:MAG: pantoate--beta-alanine ligase [Candidatus Omnitrophota bacterium]|nr:pantoate--beta-alanine ligase [Candidatus Omnitrophota bacterium]
MIRTISAMRAFIKLLRAENKTIGFVPTMGYLHQGHLSLVRAAKKDCDKVVVSIFVNPAQFGSKEDFRRYPRDLKRDEKLLKQIGVDAIFYPGVKAVYPKGYLTYVSVEKITERLCGKYRPGHFRGVATIVTKLFNIVQPDTAYFGQKDFQQARVIEKIISDLNIPLKVKVVPIVREPDGLAMSSRNVYLSPQERKDAVVLYRSLRNAEASVKRGERVVKVIIRNITKEIKKIAYARIDYVEMADTETLEKVDKINGEVVIALAVWFGKTRLIDNILVMAKPNCRLARLRSGGQAGIKW